jgi:hypothetical protein
MFVRGISMVFEGTALMGSGWATLAQGGESRRALIEYGAGAAAVLAGVMAMWGLKTAIVHD